MLEELSSRPAFAQLTPFVWEFYGAQSTYLWVDEAGRTHEIYQGEGGEQGDGKKQGGG